MTKKLSASRKTPRTQKKASRNGQATRSARIRPAIRGLNVALLRKVQKHILEEPRRLDMHYWEKNVSEEVSPCGTVACIAGWACLLSGMKVEGTVNYPIEAIKLLRIPSGNYWEGGSLADRLFLAKDWPNKFSSSYFTAQTSKTKAKVTARRIDYFIKEGK